MKTFIFANLILLLISAHAFNHAIFNSKRISTKLYEDFDLTKTTVISDPQIFSEKQLREFTSTYSVDYRMNPLEFLTGLFKKGEEKSEPTSIANSLKSTISLQVLQEKTALYVKGKINANQFKTVLKAAFGDKLEQVLPEINANLPKGKKI